MSASYVIYACHHVQTSLSGIITSTTTFGEVSTWGTYATKVESLACSLANARTIWWSMEPSPTHGRILEQTANMTAQLTLHGSARNSPLVPWALASYRTGESRRIIVLLGWIWICNRTAWRKEFDTLRRKRRALVHTMYSSRVRNDRYAQRSNFIHGIFWLRLMNIGN